MLEDGISLGVVGITLFIFIIVLFWTKNFPCDIREDFMYQFEYENNLHNIVSPIERCYGSEWCYGYMWHILELNKDYYGFCKNIFSLGMTNIYIWYLRYYTTTHYTITSLNSMHLNMWGGVDYSYYVWNTVRVRNGDIWGIDVHRIHKGHVLFFFIVHLERLLRILRVKFKCTKGAPEV